MPVHNEQAKAQHAAGFLKSATWALGPFHAVQVRRYPARSHGGVYAAPTFNARANALAIAMQCRQTSYTISGSAAKTG